LEVQRTLSVWLTPDGNDNAEFQHLVEASKQWQQLMATAKVTHLAAEFGMHQMIFQKLEYPLVATTFTQQQCAEIMHPILAQGHPLACFIRSFPRAIVHSPWQWGGLNIPNLYTEQVIAHVHTILKFGRQLGDITGSLIQASWEALILEASLAGNPANFLDTIQDYITRTWVSKTWVACQRANIQIIGAQLQFKLKRLCDTELMQLFIQQGYRKNKLAALNRCWMYTHAIFISDIC